MQLPQAQSSWQQAGGGGGGMGQGGESPPAADVSGIKSADGQEMMVEHLASLSLYMPAIVTLVAQNHMLGGRCVTG